MVPLWDHETRVGIRGISHPRTGRTPAGAPPTNPPLSAVRKHLSPGGRALRPPSPSPRVVFLVGRVCVLRRLGTPSAEAHSGAKLLVARVTLARCVHVCRREQPRAFTPRQTFLAMSGAPALPRCTDPPSSRLPVLNCAGIPDEGGFSHNGTEVRQHLCPTLDRLLRASCSQLSSPTAVASLLASELGLLSASARPSRAIDPYQATLMTGHCD